MSQCHSIVDWWGRATHIIIILFYTILVFIMALRSGTNYEAIEKSEKFSNDTFLIVIIFYWIRISISRIYFKILLWLIIGRVRFPTIYSTDFRSHNISSKTFSPIFPENGSEKDVCDLTLRKYYVCVHKTIREIDLWSFSFTVQNTSVYTYQHPL